SDLALAAAGFFENGGTELWVVRTAHYSDVSDPASATATGGVGNLVVASGAPTPAELTSGPGPFALANGDSIFLSTNTTEAHVLFTGDPGRLFSGSIEPFTVTDGQTLIVRVDGGLEQ